MKQFVGQGLFPHHSVSIPVRIQSTDAVRGSAKAVVHLDERKSDNVLREEQE